jgi:stage V sporulation protein AD
MEKRMGAETVLLPSRPGIIAGAAYAGKKEKEGPLGNLFDQIVEDDTFGEESWEKAESHFFYSAAKTCLQKAGVIEKSVQYLLGGDLLNQIMASSMAARELGIPFLGLYGACSTMSESLALGSMLVDGGFAKQVICGASSHFCTAERQYRFPLEYGSQRCPTSQWTVTGAGATLLSCDANLKPVAHVTHVTAGRLVDMGVTDANNMGAAMAPAAASTLASHFQDTGRSTKDYDRIVTGDLGRVGHDLLLELMEKKGLPLDYDHYMDCGLQIYDANQDVHAGGSGCGCSACVFNTLLINKLASGEFKRILFMAIGALLSPTSNQQGESIPGVAHAVAIESALA